MPIKFIWRPFLTDLNIINKKNMITIERLIKEKNVYYLQNEIYEIKVVNCASHFVH